VGATDDLEVTTPTLTVPEVSPNTLDAFRVRTNAVRTAFVLDGDPAGRRIRAKANDGEQHPAANHLTRRLRCRGCGLELFALSEGRLGPGGATPGRRACTPRFRQSVSWKQEAPSRATSQP